MLNYFVKQKDFINKLTFIVMAIIFAADLVFSGVPIGQKIVMYLTTAIMCILVWFGTYMVLWIQLKNPFCPDKFLDFFVISFLIVSIITSIMSLFQFLTNIRSSESDVNFAFISFTSMMSVIRFQCKRKPENF